MRAKITSMVVGFRTPITLVIYEYSTITFKYSIKINKIK